MFKVLEIARTGLTAILMHRLRSLVTTAALVVVLVPFLVGLGLSRGVQEDAETSIHCGADLYVTGSRFGRSVPVPVETAAAIRKIDGVTDVVPRIVGGIVLGKDREPAVLVGMPPERFPEAISCVDGRLPKPGGVNELVVGSELARRLRLRIGSMIPPFYRNRHGERLSTVVGIFRSDVCLWQAHLVLTPFDTAAAIFDQPGLATDLLVYCRPGYQAGVAAAVLRDISIPARDGEAGVQPRIVTRSELQALLPRDLLHREGVFNLHFVLAFAVGILVVLVTSGLGLSERRREIGILKATGWQTDEILLRGLVESCFLSLAGAAVSLVLAFFWLRGLNGYWIASIFISGVDVAPGFVVPYRLAPVPVLLAFVIAFAVVMSGTCYSCWRAATVAPREAMR
jgi:ABC-type lipoprotein release transport system permease subunit